jgi:hypothetical protein
VAHSRLSAGTHLLGQVAYLPRQVGAGLGQLIDWLPPAEPQLVEELSKLPGDIDGGIRPFR